ncbi:MAG: 2-hydroxymuconate tautomerase [Acidimicrobiales bacterium]
MPLVHIDLMEGRPPERVEEMIAAVSEAIASTLDAPIETVRVVVNEIRPHQYGVGGKPWSVVVEERARPEQER